jgi:hypothetical protein
MTEGIDPATTTSAEDLDEDRLRLDPLEEGMDPPEHWAQADRYGNTEFEQRHRDSLDHRLREEQPDVSPDDVEPDATEESEEDIAIAVEPLPADQPAGTTAAQRGQSADEAGGSVAEEFRTPHD